MDHTDVTSAALLAVAFILLVSSTAYAVRVPLPLWLEERRERQERERIEFEDANLTPEADPPTMLLLPPRGFSISITEQVGAADLGPLQPLPSPADLPVRTKGNRRLHAGVEF